MMNENEKYNKVEVKSGKGHLEKILAIADENRKLSFTLIVLVLMILYLGISLIKVKQNMIMSVDIPTNIYVSGKAQIARDRANDTFYKLWGAYIANDIIGNYTHEDIKKKYTYLLDNLSPDITGKYLSSIKTKIKNTTAQLISHTYEEGKSMMNGDQYGMTYISYGKGTKKIGEIETIQETCEYQVVMSVHNFRMKIDRIFEDCSKIEKEKTK